MARPGVDDWTKHTTPFDRVKAITLTLSEPQSAAQIAEEAVVSTETARTHLESLIKREIVVEHADGDDALFKPAPGYTRSRTIDDLLNNHDHDELIELRDKLRDRIETWQEEYAADSPDELRERVIADSSADTQENHRVIAEWKLSEYHLDIVTDAIDC